MRERSQFWTVCATVSAAPEPQWWDVQMCRDDSRTFFQNNTLWRVFSARPVTVGSLPGTACPLVLPAGDVNSSVELQIYSDVDFGVPFWGINIKYRPLVLVPTDSYVLADLEIVDAQGAVLAERTTIALGGDGTPPWAESTAAHRTQAPPTPPERPPSPPTACKEGVTLCVNDCWAASAEQGCIDGGIGSYDNTCDYGMNCKYCGPRVAGDCTDFCNFANDGVCDDGGPGSEYDRCKSTSWSTSPPPPGAGPSFLRSIDCTDCGGTPDSFCDPPSAPPRPVFEGHSDPPPPPSPPVGSTAAGGRRLLFAGLDGAEAEPPENVEGGAVAPGARRLLKGGSGRFGGTFRSTGYSGYWRSTSSTRSYSSSSYYFYDTYYYGYSGRYTYEQRNGQIGAKIVVVGCYYATESCAPCGPTCYMPPGMAQHYNVSWQYTFDELRDQFELSGYAAFVAPPSANHLRWPIKLRLSNLTVFRSVVQGEASSLPQTGTRDDRTFPIHFSFSASGIIDPYSPATAISTIALIAFLSVFGLAWFYSGFDAWESLTESVIEKRKERRRRRAMALYRSFSNLQRIPSSLISGPMSFKSFKFNSFKMKRRGEAACELSAGSAQSSDSQQWANTPPQLHPPPLLSSSQSSPRRPGR
jgi:hypothetical protein